MKHLWSKWFYTSWRTKGNSFYDTCIIWIMHNNLYTRVWGIEVHVSLWTGSSWTSPFRVHGCVPRPLSEGRVRVLQRECSVFQQPLSSISSRLVGGWNQHDCRAGYWTLILWVYTLNCVHKSLQNSFSSNMLWSDIFWLWSSLPLPIMGLIFLLSFSSSEYDIKKVWYWHLY